MMESKMEESSSFRFYYFDMKAFGEPIRLLFAYAAVPYEDVRIATEEDWISRKSGFPWGKVPVLEVDGQTLTQSQAILRYLGKRFNLAGATEFESAKCDEMVEVMSELREEGAKEFLERDPEKKKNLGLELVKNIFPKYFEKWDEILAENGGFFVGKNESYADICIAAYLQTYNSVYVGGILKSFPALEAHQDMVFNLPGIKEWVDKRPINSW